MLIATAYAATLKPWIPVFDEREFLTYGRSLALGGVYATTPDGPARDAGPGREPGYPVLIAAAAHLNPRLYETLANCWPYDPACGSHVNDLRYVNAALIAFAAWFVFLTVRTLGYGALGALVAGGYILFNIQMNKSATHVISDYLALALAALLSFALVRAISSRGFSWSVVVGLAMAALILTKSIYLLAGIILLVGILLWAGFLRRPLAWISAGLVAVTLTVPVGLWQSRNLALFGTGHDARGAVALSTREALNHMSAGENVAAFVWWTRGFGENLARRALPEDWWRRHELYAEDGFYLQGQVHRYEARLAEAVAGGLSPQHAEAGMSTAIALEILERWPSYLATMPAVFYRGLWFDEFIVVGFPALLWLFTRSLRRRDWLTLMALSAGTFSLLAYPSLSLNIPRYQFTAAPAMAIATGIAVEAFRQRWRYRRANVARPAS